MKPFALVVVVAIAALGRAPAGARDQFDTRAPLALRDVLAMKEIANVDISADAREVLFTINASDLATNTVETTLWTVSGDGDRPPSLLLSVTGAARPKWRGRSRDILFLGVHGGRNALWILAEGLRTASVILEHPDGIDSYFPSPDGNAVAFVSRAGARQTAARRRQLIDEGAILDTARHGVESTLDAWDPVEQELWIHDFTTNQTAPVALAQTPVPWSGIVDVTWSPDATRLATTVTLSDVQQNVAPGGDLIRQVILVERTPRRSWQLTGDGRYERQLPRFSPDGQRLLVAQKELFDGIAHPLRRSRYGWEHRLVEMRLDGAVVAPVSPPNTSHTHLDLLETWWARNGAVFASELVEDGLTQTIVRFSNQQTVPVARAPLTLSGCALTTNALTLACIGESVSEPPEVVVVSLETGELRRLTALNARFKEFELASIEPWTVRNRFGQRTANLLVKPMDVKADRRYPLLIVLYHFRNRFVTQAQIIPNFPVQAFARAGFVVLLANYPEYEGREPPAQKAKMAIADGPLASLEAAVASLVAAGVADGTRVGIMGWSYGAFLTELALTQSKTFVVGSAVDGGPWNPVSYWSNHGRMYRVNYDEAFGGPPEGPTLAAWQAFSPSLNVDKLAAPIMVETHSVGSIVHVQHLDFIVHASCAGAAVEGVFYANAPHTLTSPAQRMSSMERHLDWFRFWLLGEEDRAPAKRAQYERWHRLQTIRDKRVAPDWQPASWCRG